MLSPEGSLGVLRMMEIVDELKAKRLEIDKQAELLRQQLANLEDKRITFAKVISLYPRSRWPNRLPEGLVQRLQEQQAAM